ncbi:MAG: DNRLRE domain-containing protein [Actinomycetota bacterium]
MSRRAAVLCLLAMLTAVWIGRGSASSLGLSPGKITTEQKPSTVPAQSCSLATSSEDASIQEALPVVNDGSSTTIRTKSQLLGNERALVRFAIDSCGIPSTARITTATMTLHLTDVPATSRLYTVKRINASWTEGAVTWATQPGTGVLPTGSFNSPGSPGAVSVDVRSDVADIVAGTNNNHGWMIVDAVESDALGAQIVLGAREHADGAKRPTLTIGYYP